jgi:hypothetical protein
MIFSYPAMISFVKSEKSVTKTPTRTTKIPRGRAHDPPTALPTEFAAFVMVVPTEFAAFVTVVPTEFATFDALFTAVLNCFVTFIPILFIGDRFALGAVFGREPKLFEPKLLALGVLGIFTLPVFTAPNVFWLRGG